MPPCFAKKYSHFIWKLYLSSTCEFSQTYTHHFTARKLSKYGVFFWFVLSCIWTEYGDLWSKSWYSVRLQENTYQEKLRIWTLFTQCFFWSVIRWVTVSIVIVTFRKRPCFIYNFFKMVNCVVHGFAKVVSIDGVYHFRQNRLWCQVLLHIQAFFSCCNLLYIIVWGVIKITRRHSIGTYAKFSVKLKFLTPLICTRTCV